LAEAKLPPPPAKLSAEHRAVLADLKSKKAAAFDKAYIEAQYTAHVETVDLFKAYAEAGDNARLPRREGRSPLHATPMGLYAGRLIARAQWVGNSSAGRAGIAGARFRAKAKA